MDAIQLRRSGRAVAECGRGLEGSRFEPRSKGTVAPGIYSSPGHSTIGRGFEEPLRELRTFEALKFTRHTALCADQAHLAQGQQLVGPEHRGGVGGVGGQLEEALCAHHAARHLCGVDATVQPNRRDLQIREPAGSARRSEGEECEGPMQASSEGCVPKGELWFGSEMHAMYSANIPGHHHRTSGSSAVHQCAPALDPHGLWCRLGLGGSFL
eukprot:7388059-Pyramimonas_sp.AAC.1